MHRLDRLREHNDAARLEYPDENLLATAREKPNLSGLTDAEKKVWLSCEQGGLRPSELAESTKWTASTIRTILSRARRKRAERNQ
jgi:DNA-directed RNA polymerase specialized sigma24 family protein